MWQKPTYHVMHLKKSWGLVIVILKVVKKFSTSHAVYWESSTYFLLTSWSAGIIAASDSSSSSCFNTDGAFTVTLLSLTVAPRFLPAVNKEIFSSNCNHWLPALRKLPMTSNLFYFSSFTRQKGNNWTNKAGWMYTELSSHSLRHFQRNPATAVSWNLYANYNSLQLTSYQSGPQENLL